MRDGFKKPKPLGGCLITVGPIFNQPVSSQLLVRVSIFFNLVAFFLVQSAQICVCVCCCQGKHPKLEQVLVHHVGPVTSKKEHDEHGD
jgi:hypothetical protein